MKQFDVVIVGGGHAGVEAALAVARMGLRAAIVTMDPARLALMSCNPAIGGIGKSQIVKEIDALGGLMGQAIDATGIQFRRLNLSRGPAVWSTRIQADRIAYNNYVVNHVAGCKNVKVVEGLASEILTMNGRVTGIKTESGLEITSRAVIIATGTFLGGIIHIGNKQIKAGRFGENAAHGLSTSFRDLGFEIGRLKTGTPPRLDGNGIDWSKCETQPGHEPAPLFSFRSKPRKIAQLPCYLTYTTADTRKIVSANKHLSAIFSGQIGSTGPRYCPSIEDKFHRFADKERHQIFLEPEGNGTSEVYPNGFSTSLPERVQEEAIKTVIGLEKTKITRPGYAVEYDYCPAYQIKPSLETKRVAGLFLAGQINGTSGYEEAAGQGLMAGINAVLLLRGEPPFILDRSQAYLGVMIDDLTTLSTTEPYRMFTSRAEYRLSLREDNAWDRLADYAIRLSLIGKAEFDRFCTVREQTDRAISEFKRCRVDLATVPHLVAGKRKQSNISLATLFRQPKVRLEDAMAFLSADRGGFDADKLVLERAYINVRYQGYVERQAREIKKFRKMEQDRIPPDFSYEGISGLKNEAREKLSRLQPVSLGQASRIEGVTAGDLALLAVFLKRHRESAAAL